MTESEKKKIFRLHNLNKKSLENGIDLIKEGIKNSFRKEFEESQYIIKLPFTDSRRIKLLENIRSYNRILFGLLVSWSDESIRRLYYEPNVFTEAQIDYFLDRKSLEQKWTLALKVAFFKANGLIPFGNETCSGMPVNSSTCSGLSPDLLVKYNEIKGLIQDFLIPSFNIRNKVQHGEWIAAFSPPSSTEYNRDLTIKIFKENIVTISSRMIIFNSVYQMIVDLSRFSSGSFKIDVTTTPFEYFYSLHIRKIRFEKNKINKPYLNKYIDNLINRKEKGKAFKSRNSRNWWQRLFDNILRIFEKL